MNRTPHDSQIECVKEVNRAIYAVYLIHLFVWVFVEIAQGKLQFFRGSPESGVIYIPEH